MSHVLEGGEQWCPFIKKLTYILLISSRKLCPYFVAHHIIILSYQPLQNIFEQYESSKRMLKYAIELAPYGLIYESRSN